MRGLQPFWKAHHWNTEVPGEMVLSSCAPRKRCMLFRIRVTAQLPDNVPPYHSKSSRLEGTPFCPSPHLGLEPLPFQHRLSSHTHLFAFSTASILAWPPPSLPCPALATSLLRLLLFLITQSPPQQGSGALHCESLDKVSERSWRRSKITGEGWSPGEQERAAGLRRAKEGLWAEEWGPTLRRCWG